MSEIKAGAILNYVRVFMGVGIGFFISPFVLSLLGVAEYGVYTIAGTIVGWLALCDFGLTASTTKFLSEYQARKDADGEARFLGNVTYLFSLVGLVVFILGLAVYPFLNRIFPHFSVEELRLYKILYIISLINTVLMFPLRSIAGIASSRQRYIVPGIVNVVSSFVTACSTVVLLLIGLKSIALSISAVTIGVLCMVWNVYYCFGRLKARINWKSFDPILCKSVYAFSFWMFLDQLISIFNWGCGNMVVGMTCGASEVAVFSYGLMLMQYYFMGAGCLAGLFLPKVVKACHDENSNEKLTEMWIRVGRVQVVILGIMLFGVIAFGRQFLHLWIGSSLGERTTESWLVSVLLISTVTMPLVQSLGHQILQARNAIKERVKGLLLIAMLFSVLGYFVSIKYGAVGFASCVAISFVCGQWLFLNFLYKRRIGLNIWAFFKGVGQNILLPVVSLSSAVVIAFFWKPFSETWTWLGIGCIFYALFYVFIMINFYLKDEELSLLPSIVKKIRIFNKNKA